MNRVGCFIAFALILGGCAEEVAPPDEPEPAAAVPADPGAPAATTTPDCDPPYRVDSFGHKKYKVECL